jgi:hypothetical protein
MRSVLLKGYGGYTSLAARYGWFRGAKEHAAV